MIRHSGKAIWFTGLSGSGKSTLTLMLKTVLESREVPVVLLDGDVLRSGLNSDLGFSPDDRAENIRRAGQVAKILADAGHTVIAGFITPFESLRQAVRALFEPGRFVEVYLDCPVSVCETRDPKGLYCRARSGEIREFTGVTAPFEPSETADLMLNTATDAVEDSLAVLLSFLESRFPDLGCRVPVAPSGRSAARRRVAIIGTAGVPPEFVFGEHAFDLPTLKSLMNHGISGPLRSVDPPVTVPAWTCMTTGKDPGELGLYGFRNRMDYGYDEPVPANATHVRYRRLWNMLEQTGRRSIIIGVPQTYPPQPHNGITIPGFLSPDVRHSFTHPPELSHELDALAGGPYRSDVHDFQTEDKDRLLRDLRDMLERRFRTARELISRESWDFLMVVEIATDRLHRAFWRFCSPGHPDYEPGNPYENVIGDFYRFLDHRIGSLLALMDDNTTVLVVSDHGTRHTAGEVRINEWLRQSGYLVLKSDPNPETPFHPDMVDWDRTTAWAEGDSYARVFLNVAGREPQGIIEYSDYETFREKLATALQTIPDGDGKPLNTQVLLPHRIYRTCWNVPPDLMVYFNDPARRAVSTVGGTGISPVGNNTGPLDVIEDPNGIFIATRLSDLRSGTKTRRSSETLTIPDVVPTVLHEYGIKADGEFSGRVVPLGSGSAPETVPNEPRCGAPLSCTPAPVEEMGFSADEEESLKKRLANLGYI